MATLLSLASGVIPEASPVQAVYAAFDAGFEAVGLWIEPARWDVSVTRQVQGALRATGLRVLDAEVVWLRPGPFDPALLATIDIAAELGAAHVLVVSSDPNRASTLDRFVRLCEHARPLPLRVALEFGAFTDVPDLHAAAAILRDAAQPNQALLVDALHLQRSGGRPADLAALPPEWFSYAQLCDAPAKGPSAGDRAAIRAEAVDRRLCSGEGELPLAQLLAALPAHTPLSLEVRSQALRRRYPDFSERARAVLRQTQDWMRASV
ncbi:sugar phosphate isomerase/epimerase family protein [Massilia niastensis]|uniref:sugar phosphate isomerase/epimerase family protein n=1 Tax=Massilia niastensis TaxID=544911 RepID=UPI0003651268|nr:TIM barrel protein [Massilia niastensis]